MKKICLIFVSFIFVAISFGQTNMSIRAGVNIATTKNLYVFPKSRVGWYGGLSMQIPVHKKLSFQPEMLYSSKGDGIDQNVGGYKSRRLNYLNVPLLLNYSFDKKTSIVIGPEFGYLLSDILVVLNGGGETINVTQSHPSKLDLAASLGMQYKLIKTIGIEIRYNYGFNTLYSVDEMGNRYPGKKGANRVLQIGINYLFYKQEK